MLDAETAVAGCRIAGSLGSPRSVLSCYPLWKLSPETTQCVLLCLQGQAQKLRVSEPESMELGHRPGRIEILAAEPGFGVVVQVRDSLISLGLADASRWNGLTDPGYSKKKLEELPSLQLPGLEA